MIQAGKPPGGPIIERIRGLVEADLVEVLTTDLTITEVYKKHANNDYDVIKEIARPHFRKIVEETVGSKISSSSKQEIKDKLLKKYEKSTKKMFKALRARVLSIDDVKPSVVFEAYAAESGFFASEGKKSQFPDAFIFECLKAIAKASAPVIIVSDDGDFDGPVKSEKHITKVKSFPDLFTKLGLKVDAPEVGDFLDAEKDHLMEMLEDELGNWSLQGDVEDSEIDEAKVTDIEIKDVISFGSIEADESILVIATVAITADVSYSHPDWDTAAYDSEDKVLIPFDDVSGETEVKFNADISISISVDDSGEPEKIEQLSFRNDRFIYITLHQWDHYS